MKKFQFTFLFLTALTSQLCFATFQIPAKKIKQVALLIADPGKAQESSHGHAALRISWGDQLTDHDLVVNFGAKMPRDAKGEVVEPGFFINAIRGMGIANSYPSQVTASSYTAFKKNYQKEIRGVSTYTLDTTKIDLNRLANFINSELAAESASRSFQILKYNCAVMVVEALNHALLEPVHARGTNLPDELPRIFKARNLIVKNFYDPAI